MAIVERKGDTQLFARTILLSGHKAPVLGCKFSPNGRLLASVSQDKSMLVWDVFHANCECILSLRGHTNAITDLYWSIVDDSKVYTSSADGNVGVFDVNEGERVRKLQGHEGIVNACHGSSRGTQVVVSGGDDGTVKVWDPREKSFTHSLSLHLPITSLCLDEFASTAYIGSIDSSIQTWDLRANRLLDLLQGHRDTVTGLAFSQDGSYLLSNSMDETMKCWDVRPFVQGQRCLKTYENVPHSYEKGLLRCAWSGDNMVVSAGSSDRLVHLWDSSTRQQVDTLPGHNGTIYSVEFHPEEKILASCSADSCIILGYY